jgi:hypothetical protein
MKKLFVASVLALAVTMASQGTASAWSEFKFSAGINFGWVGGGNRVLWGLYESSPFPGHPGLPAYALVPTYAPCAPYGVPAVPAVYGSSHAPDAEAAPLPVTTGVPQSYNPYYNTGYQPVGYYYSGYYPSQVPSYWYGR